jgi:tRNA-dihydrouridine synthase B
LIKSLSLGNKTFPINLIQGPLAGVSCAPFRLLTWRYSKPAFSYTEMISCKTLVHQSERSRRRFIEKYPDEGPVCFQLAASDPADLSEAVKRVTDSGADLIDLNCGCPVNKIRSKKAGSALLSDPTKLYQLMQAMKKSTHLPVSIKIRVDGKSGEKYNQEIAKVVSDAGIDFLTVHGRHWTEHYDVPCRYDEIQFFVEALKIPVMGNGDVSCVDSLKKMFATGCAGVMIGRAGVGKPWLIASLAAEMRGEHFVEPSLKEIGNMLIEHVTRLCDLLGNEKFALLQARKFSKYYACGLKESAAFYAAVNGCEKLEELVLLCERYFFVAR